MVRPKRANETEVSKGGHDEIHPVCREEFTDRGKSRDFAELARHLFIEKTGDYTDYPLVVEQDHVAGYRKRPVASE